MDSQVCFTVATAWTGILTGIVTTFSILANFVKGDNLAAKIINWLALNIKVGK